jgi:hypothetical protein
MKISNKTRGEYAVDHTSNDTLPIVLRLKIQTCIGDYERINHKSPTLVILSRKVRNALFNAGLLYTPSFFSDLQNRDALTGKEFKLMIYDTNELPEKKRASIEKMLSENPETVYMGRTNWCGFGNKIKCSSLEKYDFKV